MGVARISVGVVLSETNSSSVHTLNCKLTLSSGVVSGVVVSLGVSPALSSSNFHQKGLVGMSRLALLVGGARRNRSTYLLIVFFLGHTYTYLQIHSPG